MNKTLSIAAALLSLVASASCQKEQPAAPTPKVDRYENARKITLSEIGAAAEGDTLCVLNATVIAETSEFKFITDGEGFAGTDANLKIGQKATLKGVRSNVEGYRILSKTDTSNVVESDYVAPEPVDITGNIDEYTRQVSSLVCFTGVVGSAKEYSGVYDVVVGNTVISAFHPARRFGFKYLNGHTVKITGYAFYTAEHGAFVIVTDVQDKGQMLVKWILNSRTAAINGPTFTGIEFPNDTETENGLYKSDVQYTEGDGGHYVAATVGDGMLTYVSTDKSRFDDPDPEKKNDKIRRRLDVYGRPNITGGQAEDCWLFSIDLEKTPYPAGSVLNFNTAFFTSNGGLKYWMLEILDGDAWVPMAEVTTEEVSDSSGQKHSVTYTHAQEKTAVLPIAVKYALKHETQDMLYIRYRAMSNIACSGRLKEVPDGGVHRVESTTTIDIVKSE